jgi:hypothetical protein
MFDYPFHNKGPVLVILVPGMITPSESGNMAVEVSEANEVKEAAGF